MAVKFPPPSVIFVDADAFRLASEPSAITIPGEDALPSTRLRLLMPNVKLALPYTENFSGDDV